MDQHDDHVVAAMRRALDLAAATARPSPNPRVGCVLLAPDGEVVGTGAHEGPGRPHAEALALAAAGPRARGATAVVTLEPCAHHGRTPPCADALLGAGVARVVAAQRDPNPTAAGGLERLAAAGLPVTTGVLEPEARVQLRAWRHAVRTGRPFVTWKLAATLDGRSAAADGTSRWITGAEARRDVHRSREACDAVVVGTGTVLADDPRLTVRDADGAALPPARQPLRVVVGRRDVPPDAAVLDAAASTLHLRTRDPHEVLGALAARHVQHVWLEGGPRLAGAFRAAGLVDEVVAYLAPALLGAGAAALDDPGVTTLDQASRLHTVDVTRLGDDVRITARPHAPGGAA